MTYYYLKHREKTLRRFDRVARRVRGVLLAQLGDDTDAILAKSRSELEGLLAQIPATGNEPMEYRQFLLVAAYEIALYRGMSAYGHNVEAAWRACDTALEHYLKSIPSPIRWLLKQLFFSSFSKAKYRKLARRSKSSPIAGGFAFSFVDGDGDEFDWGVDYRGCGIYNMVNAVGASEFAPYICLSDINASRYLGHGLRRDKTISQGDGVCNFRFKKGGPTLVKSKVLLSEDGTGTTCPRELALKRDV